MAETEDIQPLVCDNGTGMVKVCKHNSVPAFRNGCSTFIYFFICLIVWFYDVSKCGLNFDQNRVFLFRLDLLEMMLQEPCSQVLLVARVILGLWLAWARKMRMLEMRLSPSVVS